MAINRFLLALDVQIETFALCEVHSGWRLSFDPDEVPSIHYVLSGSGSFLLSGEKPIPLAEDTLVVLPKKVAHAFEGPGGGGREVRHDPFAGFPLRGATIPRICAGEGERCLAVACGTIHAGFGGGLGLFDELEGPIVESFVTKPLRSRFYALLEELATPTFGTRVLTEAFLKQAIVLVLRRQMKDTSGGLPWLKVLQDPRLSAAAAAMLERPADPVTLDELAATVGMSRSAFCDGFAAAFGKSPLEFLRHVRLHHAARLLAMTELPVKTVAKSIGYESRSYFSRAFRAAYGVDPTDYRIGQAARAARTGAKLHGPAPSPAKA